MAVSNDCISLQAARSAVPASFLSKFKMSSARIYLSGQNLLTIKSKSLTCPDPENPNWNYPLATSVSFGLQIGF